MKRLGSKRWTVTRFYCGVLFLALAKVSAADFPPTVPPPKPFQLPLPAVRVLSNGVRVAVIERHGLPIVTLRLVILAGAEADPPDLPGTAQLTAALLDQGTTTRTEQEIAQTIDRIGGTIDTGAEWDNSFAEISVLTDHTELAFNLLADLILHPAFSPAEIERQRKQSLSALEVAQNDPAYIADAVFDRLTFDGTPYGHPPDGTAESLRRISGENIREFYSQNYGPSNSILFIVGDIRTDEADSLAARFFAGWSRERLPASARVTAKVMSLGGEALAQENRRIVVIDKPDAVQTEIRIGNRAISRTGTDYLALSVANQILGGPATNRLFQALRTEHGLTYSASSELDCYKTLGSWESKTFTRTSETMKSVRLVLDQMKRMRDQPISGAELHTAQSYLAGHLALEVESSEGIATQMLNLMVYDLPLDYWNHFPEDLRNLQADEVLNATQRYLDPDRDVIVLVGNAATFSRELKKLGNVRVVPIQRLDLASPDLERHAEAAGNP